MITVKGIGRKKKPIKKPVEHVKKVREPRACKICGAMFVPKKEQHYTCGHECHIENQKRLRKIWYRKNADRLIRKQQSINVYKPSGTCKICGETIVQEYASPNHRSTKQYHDECVYKQCLEVLSRGEPLNKSERQLLYARGWTQKEFIGEFLNGRV